MTLRPIIVAGLGRSGKTAFLSLLASDPAMAVDRVYPYENRYLTYLAKFVLLLTRREPVPSFADADLCQFQNCALGLQSWSGQANTLAAVATTIPDRHIPWLRALWQTFSQEVTHGNPEARFYAEKAPPWVGPLVRDGLVAATLYVSRDPRDIYISANAFMRKQNYYGFGRSPGDTDVDHARTLARGFTEFCENYRMSRHREDCLLVRYAELVNGKEELSQRIERHLGIHTQWDKLDRLEAHQTAGGLDRSLNRWQNEPIPSDVRRFFETHLREEMTFLGFATEERTERHPLVEFRSSTSDAAHVQHSADGSFRLREEYTDICTTGPDFWMILPFAPFDAGAIREVWVSLNGVIGDVCSLYWRGPDEGFAEERSIHLQFWPGLHWQVIRFRAGQHPLWKGIIAELRLDPFNVHHTGATGNGRLRWVRLLE